MFKDIEEIKKAGFMGFKKMDELFVDNSSIPRIPGVYLILSLHKNIEFLTVGSGGFFKGKNPNVPIDKLKKNWVEKTPVVYIGKAGKDGSNVTLHSRLKCYLRFGKGKNVAHWGGRLIWQLKNYNDLVVCWKSLPKEDPRTIEKSLIRSFILEYSKKPFANLNN